MFVYLPKQHPLKVRELSGSWQQLVLSDAFLNRQCVHETEVQGLEYVGFLARTQDDEPCVRWDSLVESEGTADFVFPDGSRTLAADYCRNPGGRERDGPWCYTDTAGTWNNCSVPICGEYARQYRLHHAPVQIELVNLEIKVLIRTVTIGYLVGSPGKSIMNKMVCRLEAIITGIYTLRC